jgi:hypothetical protein
MVKRGELARSGSWNRNKMYPWCEYRINHIEYVHFDGVNGWIEKYAQGLIWSHWMFMWGSFFGWKKSKKSNSPAHTDYCKHTATLEKTEWTENETHWPHHETDFVGLLQNTDRNVHHETDFIRATAKHWVRVRGEGLHCIFLAKWKFSLPGLDQEGRHPPQKGPQKELDSGQCTGIHPTLAIRIYKLSVSVELWNSRFLLGIFLMNTHR